MKQRVITGAVLVAVVVPPIILGGIWMYLLISVASVLATYEYLLALLQKKNTLLYGLTAVLSAGLIASFLMDPALFPALLGILIIALYFINVNDEQFNIEKISYIFMFFVLLSLGLKAFLVIRQPGFEPVIYILLLTYFADSFALIGGKQFGKHKLNERISPKKTIEGAICGYICGALAGIVYALFFTNMDKVPAIIGALIIPMVSQLGDLALSSVKRHFQIKDFSNIFPGHGGMLDRIDSLLFALLTYSIIFVR